MKKFILLCFGLLIAGVAAFAVPQDFKKEVKKDYQIEKHVDAIQVSVESQNAGLVLNNGETYQEIFISQPFIHTKRTGIEKPMSRYIRTWYSSIIKSTYKDHRPGIENELILTRRYC